jgi:hypothetical protein
MGQKNPVHVYILVTADTLEENLLVTIAGKQSLFTAVLDPEADVSELSMSSGLEELKKRLEILLGNKPKSAIDESMKAKAEAQAELLKRKERMSQAGGQLLGAAFTFIGELFPEQEDTEKMDELASKFRERLSQCIEEGPDGQLQMTVTLPDKGIIDDFAKSLARVIGE